MCCAIGYFLDEHLNVVHFLYQQDRPGSVAAQTFKCVDLGDAVVFPNTIMTNVLTNPHENK